MTSRVRRILLSFSFLLVATIGTLAFIPHYGCACGEIEKVNGSQLEYLPQTIAEFVIEIIQTIF